MYGLIYLKDMLSISKLISIPTWGCFIINVLSLHLRALYFVEINYSFLSDIATFNLAIIGLWVPLSISIINKMTERYSSDIIARAFERHPANTLLLNLLILNLIITILMRFFLTEKPINDISWLVVSRDPQSNK